MCGIRELVFVYGTLRCGGSNHFRMFGADAVAEGFVAGRIYRISWYPGLVLGGEGEVKGEIYSVDADLLKALDAFEGLSAGEVEGSEYRRAKTMVTCPDGRTFSAWVWEWIGPLDGKDFLEQGDWLMAQSCDQ